MPYNFVQPIAYEINTYPVSTYTHVSTDFVMSGGVWWNAFKYIVTKKYPGAATDREDIDFRCTLMQEAITKTAARAQVSSASGCLKVFMAPEFYFRGTQGAYSLDDMQYLIGKLQAMVQGEQWRDWLFVFGSILATFEPARTELLGSKEGHTLPDAPSMALGGGGMKNAILNVTLVQKGNAGQSGARVVMKDLMSHIDFLNKRDEWKPMRDNGGNHVHTPTSVGPVPNYFHNVTQDEPHLWDETVDHLRSGKAQYKVQQETIQSKDSYAGPAKAKDVQVKYVEKVDANKGAGKELQGGLNWTNASGAKYEGHDSGLGIFELDGITFGLEICLDHLSGRLKASPPDTGQKWVQVQLVPSAGAWIVDANAIATQGGVVFNCDGAAKSDVKTVVKDWKEGGGPTLKPRAATFRVEAIHDGGANKAAREKCFQADGRVRIYPTLRVPGKRNA
jgi:hypothetical protein